MKMPILGEPTSNVATPVAKDYLSRSSKPPTQGACTLPVGLPAPTSFGLGPIVGGSELWWQQVLHPSCNSIGSYTPAAPVLYGQCWWLLSSGRHHLCSVRFLALMAVSLAPVLQRLPLSLGGGSVGSCTPEAPVNWMLSCSGVAAAAAAAAAAGAVAPPPMIWGRLWFLRFS